MASSSRAAGGLDVKRLKDELYQACEGLRIIKQNDIEELGIEGLEDLNDTMIVVQALVDDKLFKLVQDDGSIAWKARTVDDAKRYRSLSPEQSVVYELIDDAGQEGLWTKTIKTRTNLHDSLFNAAIKFLNGKGYIAEMKSVEHPSRKMWIKSSLRPSDRATGGPWYTDGELDEEFIATIIKFLRFTIVAATFYQSKIPSAVTRKAKKVHGKKLTPEEVKAARAAALGYPTAHDSDLSMPDERTLRALKLSSQLPMPTSYTSYPSVDTLTVLVLESGLTTSVLTAADIQQLLDIMIYDDIITKVLVGDSVGYKAQRSTLVDEDDLGSVLSEAPCGRCPVFDLCEEGGPVGPSNCEYFNTWLGL